MSRRPNHKPRTVRREEHVEVSFDKDGITGVKAVPPPPAETPGEFGEPCYDCSCCLKWTETLELLRAHVIAHNARVPALFPCPDECLVCQSSAWAGK